MKKINLTEEAYERLKKKITESTYGNDDLSSFYEDLEMSFRDFYSVLGEHYIMLGRMGQEPDEMTSEIKDCADRINLLLQGK